MGALPERKRAARGREEEGMRRETGAEATWKAIAVKSDRSRCLHGQKL